MWPQGAYREEHPPHIFMIKVLAEGACMYW